MTVPGPAPADADAYWRAYFDAMADSGPRETLLFALRQFERDWESSGTWPPAAPKSQGAADAPAAAAHTPGTCPCHPATVGVALDLACGEGRDTIELLRRHWCVLAVDGHPEAIARLRARVPEDLQAYLRAGIETFEDLPLPPGMFDLVNASFALPHCPKDAFAGLWSRLVASIRGPGESGASPRGGRFAGQFFGVEDSFARQPEPGIERIFHTRTEVERLLVPFELERFEEINRPGRDAFGQPKHWHVFHVVARKRG